MTVHTCPLEIQRLFETRETWPEGRRAVMAWVNGLALEVGDRVLMPDMAMPRLGQAAVLRERVVIL